ncbi:SKP1/BTB/POZ domain-containing protein [Artemisia annua]|uniref:SKP1/BTB/POZ domain-containing protein n=1 Tax=Artemisia annua TaxID=35608 RepID=A0A2U1NFR3_ARTAN|nr:SKP1/BTB/POZ domain-containing protein [Artemisia annua]
MASFIVKRVASNLMRVRAIASSSRFYNTRCFQYDKRDSDDVCILKCDSKPGSSAHHVVNTSFDSHASPIGNLVRLLNLTDDIIGGKFRKKEAPWNVVEDDKALYLIRNMHTSNKGFEESAPQMEFMFAIHPNDVKESVPPAEMNMSSLLHLMRIVDLEPSGYYYHAMHDRKELPRLAEPASGTTYDFTVSYHVSKKLQNQAIRIIIGLQGWDIEGWLTDDPFQGYAFEIFLPDNNIQEVKQSRTGTEPLGAFCFDVGDKWPKSLVSLLNDRVKICLNGSTSKHEIKDLKRKLEQELEQVRVLYQKLEKTENEIEITGLVYTHRPKNPRTPVVEVVAYPVTEPINNNDPSSFGQSQDPDNAVSRAEHSRPKTDRDRENRRISSPVSVSTFSLFRSRSGSSPITASFNMRLVSVVDGRKTLQYTQFRDMLIDSGDMLGRKTGRINWVHGVSLTNRFIIEVEFLDLKTASPNVGSPPSIWSERFTVNQNAKAMSAFGRLFSESIHTDIIISASNGSIAAHRAVLAARSPVFDRMFTQDLKEKDASAINIPDMSIELTQAFLSYLYSNNIEYQDFLSHRFDLLRAADKYDVADLKEACQENIIEDIHSENVLERLQISFMYHASRLKVCCIEYLVKFGKVLDMKEEFDAFLQSADRELVSEVVNEILSAWKPV